MKIKFGVFDKFKFFKVSKFWKLWKAIQIEKKIKVIKFDGKGEYNSKNFNAFCKENDIVKQITIPYILEQNGVTERKNWTLVESVQCMLQHMKSDNKLGAKAVTLVTYI